MKQTLAIQRIVDRMTLEHAALDVAQLVAEDCAAAITHLAIGKRMLSPGDLEGRWEPYWFPSDPDERMDAFVRGLEPKGYATARMALAAGDAAYPDDKPHAVRYMAQQEWVATESPWAET